MGLSWTKRLFNDFVEVSAYENINYDYNLIGILRNKINNK